MTRTTKLWALMLTLPDAEAATRVVDQGRTLEDELDARAEDEGAAAGYYGEIKGEQAAVGSEIE